MNIELLNAAKKALNVQQITMAESSFKLHKGHTYEDLQKIRFQSFNFTKGMDVYDLSDGSNSVIYQYSVGFRAILNSDEMADPPLDESAMDILYEVQAIFEASYVYTDDLAEDCLEEFGLSNVGYHVWPFWREYIQSTANRMGVIPPALGFYNSDKN